jgi:hypothetical protein
MAYGGYLANLAHCVRCHSPLTKDDEPMPGMSWSGGQLFGPPGHVVASSNITEHASGIPHYDVGVFIKTMRTGGVNGVRELNNIMPWGFFQHMTDQDLRDVFAYVKANAKAVAHSVDNREPPTLCPIDGNLHGFGSRNRRPAAVRTNR